MLRAFGPVHVGLYRLFRGRLVGNLSQGFMPLLLLTTIGRKSGRPRTQPIGYVRDGPAFLIVASYGGLPSSPGWFYNLRGRPNAGNRTRWLADARSGDDPRRRRASACVAEGHDQVRILQRLPKRHRPHDPGRPLGDRAAIVGSARGIRTTTRYSESKAIAELRAVAARVLANGDDDAHALLREQLKEEDFGERERIAPTSQLAN